MVEETFLHVTEECACALRYYVVGSGFVGDYAVEGLEVVDGALVGELFELLLLALYLTLIFHYFRGIDIYFL